MTSERSSLNDLKVDDAVAIVIGGHAIGHGLRRGVVVRITNTQIVATYLSKHQEMKFRKADGNQVGGDRSSYYRTTIEPFTEKHAEIINSCDRTFKVKQIADLITKHAHLVTAGEVRELDRIKTNLKARAAGFKE